MDHNCNDNEKGYDDGNDYQSGRSPKVVALFSATNLSSYILELFQLHDKIQIKWNDSRKPKVFLLLWDICY